MHRAPPARRGRPRSLSARAPPAAPTPRPLHRAQPRVGRRHRPRARRPSRRRRPSPRVVREGCRARVRAGRPCGSGAVACVTTTTAFTRCARSRSAAFWAIGSAASSRLPTARSTNLAPPACPSLSARPASSPASGRTSTTLLARQRFARALARRRQGRPRRCAHDRRQRCRGVPDHPAAKDGVGDHAASTRIRNGTRNFTQAERKRSSDTVSCMPMAREPSSVVLTTERA